jgi:hypothetical protein
LRLFVLSGTRVGDLDLQGGSVRHRDVRREHEELQQQVRADRHQQRLRRGVPLYRVRE